MGRKSECVYVLSLTWRYNGSDRMTGLAPRSNKGDRSLCRFITAVLKEKPDGGWKGSSLSRISYASFESHSLCLFNFMPLRMLYCLSSVLIFLFLHFLSFCVIFKLIFFFVLTVVFLCTLTPPSQGFRQQLFPLSAGHSSLYYSGEPFKSLYVWDWWGQIDG